MPEPDPVPSPNLSTKRRFWRIFRVLVALALVIAAIAVVLVSEGDPTLHINMMIATALGVFFTILLGTTLMTLTFLSSASGHDEAAATHVDQEEKG